MKDGSECKKRNIQSRKEGNYEKIDKIDSIGCDLNYSAGSGNHFLPATHKKETGSFPGWEAA